MCGLIGAAGNITHELKSRVFKDMLDVCATRGRDSTGIIIVKKDLSYDWIKQLGSPAYLYDSRQYEQRVERTDAAALIGHCRAKTVGDVSIKNAHPFDFPEAGICGVHNGTLRNQHSLDTHKYGQVDSETMYGHLAKNGPEDTFKKVDGAYTAIWWNDKEKTINFIRNTERPLWLSWSKDLKTMFWASEIWMFGAINRKIELWDGGEEKKVYRELEPHKLHSFRINPNAKGDEKLLALRPLKEILLEKKSYTPHHQRNWQSGGHGVGFHGDRFAGRVNGWEHNGDGTYSRKADTGPDALGVIKGGEVKDPFQAPDSGGQRKPLVIIDGDKLDDELDLSLFERIGSTPANGTNSPISNVEFLKSSVNRSGSSKEQSSTKSSKRSKTSLPGLTSKISLPNSKDDLSKACNVFSINSRKTQSRLLSSGVSYRIVAGMEYITRNETHHEYDFLEFHNKMGGCCSFCKTPLETVFDVGDILSDDSYICKQCLREPASSPMIEAC